MKTLYASTRSEVRPLSGEVVTGLGTEERKEDRRIRSLSGKHNRSRQPSRNVSGNTSSSESSSDEEEIDICQTLTDIASGCTVSAGVTADFFGDGELGLGLGMEHLTSLEGGGIGGCIEDAQNSSQDFAIPIEAFEQRQEISEAGKNEELLTVEGDDSVHTVTVEDKTSSVVVWGTHAALNTTQIWDICPFVTETLNWYAESGDIQSAVSMYIVLAVGRSGEVNSKMKGLVEESVVEHWFLSYIDLLQRLQLFTIANEVIRLCPLATVNTMNCQSTTILSSCGSCGRTLARLDGIWWCEKCRKSPSTCSVCHAVVRGLLVWCQGCGHGGHVEHVKKWLTDQNHCPAGCGHHCQY